MSPKRIGPIAQAWFKWKALRLPWRKNFLVGFDLEGNTYWEFRLTRGSGANSNESNGAGHEQQQQQQSGEERWRRIVKYPRSTYLSDVKVSPQWHQWLRHMRRDPPPLEEQRNEVMRQARMRQLANAADARWEAKPRLVGEVSHEPQQQQQQQEEQQQQLPSTQQQKPNQESAAQQSPTESVHDQDKTHEKEEKSQHATVNDPWARAKAQGPSENWQPTAWNPTATKNR